MTDVNVKTSNTSDVLGARLTWQNALRFPGLARQRQRFVARKIKQEISEKVFWLRREPDQSMKDWNVIVTVSDRDGYRHARRRLRHLGPIESTNFHNVLVMRVPDVAALLKALAEMTDNDMSLYNDISRLIPAEVTFDFETKEEFESKARAVILGWADRIAGMTFHIRLNRRGLRDLLRSPAEERLLDDAMLGRLAEIGRPGRIRFTDPDCVIDIETVGNRAGLSMWSRDDLHRYPFLNID